MVPPVATAQDELSWRHRTNLVAGAILLMTAAFMAVKTARDALYFHGDGLQDLPKAYIGITILSLPLALAMLELMRRLGTRRTRWLSTLSAAAALALFAPFAVPGGGVAMTLFFMSVPLVFGVLFSSSWLLAADLLDRAPRAQLAHSYARIGGASMLGAVAAGGLAALTSTRAGPQALLGLGALLLAASAAVLALGQRRYPMQRLRNARPVRKPEWHDLVAALRDPYAFRLVLVGAVAALVGVLIEFQFYLAASTSGQTARENVGFFAHVYLTLSLVAFFLQVVIVPRLQTVIGIHRALLVLPAGLLAVLSGFVLGPAMLSRSLLRLTEGGLKSSVHRSSWEQAILVVPPERRPVTKLLVDGAGARTGEGLAATLLQLWLSFGSGGGGLMMGVPWITAVIAASLLFWLAMTLSLRASLSTCAALQVGGERRLDMPLPDT